MHYSIRYIEIILPAYDSVQSYPKFRLPYPSLLLGAWPVTAEDLSNHQTTLIESNVATIECVLSCQRPKAQRLMVWLSFSSCAVDKY